MTWFYWATSSIIFFSILSLLQRSMSIDAKYPRAMSIVFNLWGIFFALLAFFVTGGHKNFVLPREPVAWVFMVLASIFYALFERWRFLSSSLLEASVISVISNVSLVVAFLGSLFLYSESITPEKALGVLLILTALVLVGSAGGMHKKIPLRNLLIGVAVSFFLGLGWMLDKKGALFFRPDIYNIFVWVVPIFFVYFPYVKFSHLRHEASRNSWKFAILAGVNVIGYLLQLRALALGQATQVIPIVQTSTLLTVILGIFILKENQNVLRKILSAVIALAGVFLLVGT